LPHLAARLDRDDVSLSTRARPYVVFYYKTAGWKSIANGVMYGAMPDFCCWNVSETGKCLFSDKLLNIKDGIWLFLEPVFKEQSFDPIEFFSVMSDQSSV
jgi:hypothetical protein